MSNTDNKSNKRSPICAVMGHVDHGKSSLLDYIRHTNIVSREAGAITQAIGASIVPMSTIGDLCKTAIPSFDIKNFNIPGLLFIDTPGHAAFTNLRKRGGNLADIAILVVNINEGFMPQTIEAIKILKEYKTPFVVAANKIDLIQNYRSNNKKSVLQSISQDVQLLSVIETKIYELVGKIFEFGFESERFDRVEDFTRQIAIVPISALKGDGVPELMMVLSGIAQKFLEKQLKFDINSPAKGTILEVKEEQGVGTSLDIIIYDGNIKCGDSVVVGTLDEPVVGKVRCLFEPAPHSDMMDKKSKYKSIKQAFAATGVKLSGPNLEKAVAGMPIRVVGPNENEELVIEKIKSEIEEVIVESDLEGVILKADSLGSLEAVSRMLREEGFKVRKATVGEISRKDISDAEANLDKYRLNAVILGFNVKESEHPKEITIFTSNIIYKLIDNFKEWRTSEYKKIELEKLADLNKPVKFEYLQNHTFRQNNPAIIGVEILAGNLKSGTQIMNKEGKVVGVVKQIRKDNKSVNIAEKGDQVAISIEGVTAGRQIHEEDILYSNIIESEYLKFKKIKDFLEGHEKEVLKEIAEIKRQENPVWGV